MHLYLHGLRFRELARDAELYRLARAAREGGRTPSTTTTSKPPSPARPAGERGT